MNPNALRERPDRRGRKRAERRRGAAVGGRREGPRREVTLDDKYLLEEGRILLTGVQALVRVLLDQHRADRAPRTADRRARVRLPGLAARRPRPGARALRDRAEHSRPSRARPERGARRHPVVGHAARRRLPGPRYDGVVGVWYGKAPGLDRAADALRHGNFAGIAPHGGALALVRRRPELEVLDAARAHRRRRSPRLHMPVFPGDVQEVLDLGLHAIACSRASGLWAGLKVVTNVADASGTAAGRPERVSPVMPEVELERAALRARAERQPAGAGVAGARAHAARRRASSWRRRTRAERAQPDRRAPRDAWLGIVAAGKAHYDLLQALARARPRRARARARRRAHPEARDDLAARPRGVRELRRRARRDPRRRGEAARSWRRALKEALYGTADAPRIVGKRDERGAPLLPAERDLDADVVARAVAARLAPRPAASVDARIARAGRSPAGRAPLPLAARTPFFCSGCPHNTLHRGARGHARRRRHRLPHDGRCSTPRARARSPASRRWAARARSGSAWRRSPTTAHLVQNIGDGTFFHSGSLADPRRGRGRGQHHLQAALQRRGRDDRRPGRRGPADRARADALAGAEGVQRIIVTTEDPSATAASSSRRSPRCATATSCSTPSRSWPRSRA